MANKATKTLARANASTLTRTHLTSLGLHTLFILYRLLYRHGRWTPYLMLSLPSLLIEYYLERLGRPTYTPSGDLRNPGEDMDAKGVTEYLWDIIYVHWAVMALVSMLGETLWWGWLVIPLYAVYLGITTYNGMRGMMPGMPAAPEGPPSDVAAGMSNRQKKAERRGGQKVRYQ